MSSLAGVFFSESLKHLGSLVSNRNGFFYTLNQDMPRPFVDHLIHKANLQKQTKRKQAP